MCFSTPPSTLRTSSRDTALLSAREASAVSLPAYTANFSSGRENNIYDFYVDFGELSQLKLTMNAYSGTSNPIEVKSPASEDSTSSTGYVQITTQVTQTTISWDDPMIEKGGAAS